MATKHSKLPQEKQIKELLLKEIEEFGFQIGSRAVDWLNMIKDDPHHYNSTMELVKFLISEFWFFVFPGEVSLEELGRNMRLQA